MRSNALALTNTKNKSGKRAGAVYDAHGRRSCFQNSTRRLREISLLYSNVLCSSAVDGQRNAFGAKRSASCSAAETRLLCAQAESSAQPRCACSSDARRRVFSLTSSNIAANLERMPSGGPPSMISRRELGTPMEISCLKEGSCESVTYVANQRSSSERKRGNRQ